MEIIAAGKELAKFLPLLDYGQKHFDNLPTRATEDDRQLSQNRLNLRLKNVENATKKLNDAREKQAHRAEWLDKAKNSLSPSTARLTTHNALTTQDSTTTHDTENEIDEP